jgi:hypothetical protein
MGNMEDSYVSVAAGYHRNRRRCGDVNSVGIFGALVETYRKVKGNRARAAKTEDTSL